MQDLLSIRDTSLNDLQLILENAVAFKEVLRRPVKKVPALRGRTVVTLFYEASTRTRTSFELAAKYLGADAVNIAVAQSSVTKGESLKDTMRTLEALTADCIVIRHSSSGAPALAAALSDVPVVNAGDGRHEHPTQALLDAMTIWEHCVCGLPYTASGSSSPSERRLPVDLSGLTVAIVGDLSHSRVARSNAWCLSRLGATVRWVGPRTLIPECASGLPISVHTNLEEGIAGADVVMVLRLQTERQEAGLLPSLREYSRHWGVSRTSLRAAKPGAIVMHPGPMNRGVEISPEVADQIEGTPAVIERQVTNGVAVRMACLYLLAAGANAEAAL